MSIKKVFDSEEREVAPWVQAFFHVAMGRQIDPSWWTHWAIYCSSHAPSTGVTKVVIYVILSVR